MNETTKIELSATQPRYSDVLNGTFMDRKEALVVSALADGRVVVLVGPMGWYYYDENQVPPEMVLLTPKEIMEQFPHTDYPELPSTEEFQSFIESQGTAA